MHADLESHQVALRLPSTPGQPGNGSPTEVARGASQPSSVPAAKLPRAAVPLRSGARAGA